MSLDDGFYLKTDPNADELTVTLEASTPGLDATGSLNILSLQATDLGSTVAGVFSVDLEDPNSDGKLLLSEMGSDMLSTAPYVVTDVDIRLATRLGNDGEWPSIYTTFALDWSYLEGGRPAIQFKDTELELGKFVTKYVKPFLNELNTILIPVRPIFDVLNKKVPVLADIDSLKSKLDVIPPPGVRFTDLASLGLDYINPAWGFLFDPIVQIEYYSRELNLADDSVTIQLGTLNLGKRKLSGSSSSFSAEDLEVIGNELLEEVPDGPAKDFIAGAQDRFEENGKGRGLIFPLFEDPTLAFQLLFGNNVDLVYLDLPQINLSVPIGPITSNLFGGFLKSTFEGKFELAFNVDFGYDTEGLRRFILSDHPEDLFAGFFVTDAIKGVDRPEVAFGGFIEASGEVKANLPSIGFEKKILGKTYSAKVQAKAEAEVSGGVYIGTKDSQGKYDGPVTFDLVDNDGDGKVRIDEFQANGSCSFTSHGSGTASLYASVDIGGSVSFAGKDYSKTIIDKELKFDDVTFFSVEHECSAAASATPVLGRVENNTLYLNMGEDRLTPGGLTYGASQRLHGNIEDGSEKFRVQAGEALGTYVVSAFSHEQTFAGITKIVAFGGQGDDRIVVEGGTRVIDVIREEDGTYSPVYAVDDSIEIELSGNGGSDYLAYVGGGQATLHGGSGDDTLIGGFGGDTLEGDTGNDSLTGGDGDDTLRGHDGDDVLVGQGGDDMIFGGSGNDTLRGGAGEDTLKGEAGFDDLDGGEDDDQLDGGEDDDVLRGDDGDDVLRGGGGADQLSGDAGDDELYGDAGVDLLLGGDGKDTLRGGDGDDLLDGEAEADQSFGDAGDDLLYGGDGGDTLEGGADNDEIYGERDNDIIRGDSGNDVLDGGGGDDQLFGGTGDDVLVGDDGADSLYGESGNDKIYGDRGNDFASGGDDNDLIVGASGNDTLEGDAVPMCFRAGPEMTCSVAEMVMTSWRATPETIALRAAPTTMSSAAGQETTNCWATPASTFYWAIPAPTRSKAETTATRSAEAAAMTSSVEDKEMTTSLASQERIGSSEMPATIRLKDKTAPTRFWADSMTTQFVAARRTT